MRNATRTACQFLVIGVVGTAAIAAAQSPPSPSARLSAIRAAGQSIRALHKKKAPVQPGDWLERHPEPGQTFDQYRASNPNRPRRGRDALYILPLGDFSPQEKKIVQRTKEFLGAFYGLPIRELKATAWEALPAEARKNDPSGNPRLYTPYLLQKLLPGRRPADAAALLAVTKHDLLPEGGLSFVFGQATYSGVGVVSLARLGDANSNDAGFAQVLKRFLKVATHETGHMLGIHHCKDYECDMNAPNHLTEMDRNRLWFCPECEQKVWWACPVDARARYKRLSELADANELRDERDFWKQSLERLGK